MGIYKTSFPSIQIVWDVTAYFDLSDVSTANFLFLFLFITLVIKFDLKTIKKIFCYFTAFWKKIMLFTGKLWLNVNSYVTQLLDSQHMRSRSQENSKAME